MARTIVALDPLTGARARTRTTHAWLTCHARRKETGLAAVCRRAQAGGLAVTSRLADQLVGGIPFALENERQEIPPRNVEVGVRARR